MKMMTGFPFFFQNHIEWNFLFCNTCTYKTVKKRTNLNFSDTHVEANSKKKDLKLSQARFAKKNHSFH